MADYSVHNSFTRRTLVFTPENLIFLDGLWRLQDGRIWIADNDTDLQLRLSIIAHTGSDGRRGRKDTEASLTKRFHCLTLSEDIRLFVSASIQCISTNGGEGVLPIRTDTTRNQAKCPPTI